MNIVNNKNLRLTRWPSNLEPQPIMVPREDIVWEAGAVFNPTVYFDGELFHMLYRTYTKSLDLGERRQYRPGNYFINQHSYIGYAVSNDGINFERFDNPLISPDKEFDKFGCEDPRMIKIDDTFYITYTAIDGDLSDRGNRPNVRIALAFTKDFKTVTKHGIIGPAKESKAAALFPKKINGKIGFIYTDQSDSVNSRISLHYFDSIEQILNVSYKDWAEFLDKDKIIFPSNDIYHRGPELGAVPIETK